MKKNKPDDLASRAHMSTWPPCQSQKSKPHEATVPSPSTNTGVQTPEIRFRAPEPRPRPANAAASTPKARGVMNRSRLPFGAKLHHTGFPKSRHCMQPIQHSHTFRRMAHSGIASPMPLAHVVVCICSDRGVLSSLRIPGIALCC